MEDDSSATPYPPGYLASSPEDARDRFAKTRQADPFPEIKPALLNSADIIDYIAATAMVYEFHPSRLKSASISVRCGEEFIFWGENGERKHKKLLEGESFELPPNSIAFVSTEEYFRLPEYMAMRFNLHITFVHRGLLLGTGPLVDPGFEGYLLIPLHNLTNNPYTIRRGEDLIWVEFTKLSPNPRWNPDEDLYISQRRWGKYEEFKEKKKKITPWGYILKAMFDKRTEEAVCKDIRSSIPKALYSAQRDARRAKGTLYAIAGFGAFSILISIISAGFVVFQLFGQVEAMVHDSTVVAGEAKKQAEFARGRLDGYISKLDSEMNRQALENNRVEEKLDELRSEIEKLRSDLDDLAKK